MVLHWWNPELENLLPLHPYSFMTISSPDFAENVYGCENISIKNFVLILKNNMAAIVDC